MTLRMMKTKKVIKVFIRSTTNQIQIFYHQLSLVHFFYLMQVTMKYLKEARFIIWNYFEKFTFIFYQKEKKVV